MIGRERERNRERENSTQHHGAIDDEGKMSYYRNYIHRRDVSGFNMWNDTSIIIGR
jgi:hypothetical protein